MICNYIGVCRRAVCESALCRRSYIAVCSGGEVSVRVLCVAAVVLVFARV